MGVFWLGLFSVLLVQKNKNDNNRGKRIIKETAGQPGKKWGRGVAVGVEVAKTWIAW